MTFAIFFVKMLSVPCEDCAMRLNLREIIHVPGAAVPFDFTLDLTQEDFFGEQPITQPVYVTGRVKNIADVLVLEGQAKSVLDYTCDRCMGRFSREKTVKLSYMLAEEMEGEEDGEIVLLDDGEIDIGDLAYTAFILDTDADIVVEVELAIIALVLCLVQFRVGRWMGGLAGDAIAGGQSVGQKNTILAVWMSLNFLDPVASIAPTAYIVWQNFVNSYQLSRVKK